MALSQEVSAPYAPQGAIIGLLEKNRSTGLPSLIDKSALSRLGISESLLDRTFQALIVLDLIDESGTPTEVLKGFRVAPEAEYTTRLAEWLNHAYSDIVQFSDPYQGDEVQVRDAFRTYSPQSQIDRMVSLFIGLYRLAGVWPEVTKKVSPKNTPKATQATKPRTPKRTKTASPSPPPPPISETALEYRLVDLMSEAASDPELMQAIIKVITFLKTKDSGLQKEDEEQ